MASETQVGQLVIDLKIKTDALEKGLETAKKKIQDIEKQNKELENSNKGVDASFIALTATAIASLAKIGEAVKDCVNEYKEYTQAMSSLQNVSDYTGESMSEFSDIMDEFGAYMTKSDLATTIKNFSLMGMTTDQTRKMVEALTNSAIKNKNANYTVSEAVRVASEGYRQGLSTLSDSAGVTENLSAMLDNYAKSIGKTASQLTEMEKNQAYLNRTMYAAEPFAGAMGEYLDSLAGKQGQYSQALRETQVAYAESIEPMLVKFEELKTKMMSGLGELISSNDSATAGITVFGVAVLGLGTILTIGAKGVQIYTAAINALNISTKMLKATMTGMLIFTTVIAAVVALTTAIKENEEAQRKLTEAEKEYKDMKEGKTNYTDDEIATKQKEIANIKEQQKYLQEMIEQEKIINAYKQQKKSKNQDTVNDGIILISKEEYKEAKENFENAEKQFKEAAEAGTDYTATIQDNSKKMEVLNEQLKTRNDYIDKGTAKQKAQEILNVKITHSKQQEAVQLKNNSQEMQKYFNIIKKGQNTTEEYKEAYEKLSKEYPEAIKNEKILTDEMQKCIDIDNQKAEQSWKNAQDEIASKIKGIELLKIVAKEAENDKEKQKSLADSMNTSYENVIPTLENTLKLLLLMQGKSPEDIKLPETAEKPKTTKSSASSSYSNKKLDNYKKEIEHKKAMDQISLNDEIKMYEKALRSYAKTTDEKRELREKIYELNKEMANKEKELLDQQTEDYEVYIEEQKRLRGAAYSPEEQTKDYDKIIKMHKSYLDQIMKDERLSLDERKELYREELETIRDYEKQKYDLRVEQIDNTVSQLTDAITKKLEDMQSKEKEIIDKNLEMIEEWKNARINAINEEYDARIEAIEKELEALDKAEKQKSRDEEDEEFNSKKQRLEDLIAYEHDETTKANYQKELNKLIEEHEKTLNQRVLEDKKEALNEQKDLLKDEQQAKIEAIEKETEKRREEYEKQLQMMEEYYEEQISKAEETAQMMLLNVEQNQNEILELLQTYGDAYAITGQTFGEKLGNSFADTAMNIITTAISNIQKKIDSAIASNIARLQASAKAATASSSNTTNKTVNVTQHNTFTSYADSPSRTLKKQETINRNLASSISRIF